MKDFVFFYQNMLNDRLDDKCDECFQKHNISFLAFNIANLHWVLVKIAKENNHYVVDYYDPKGEQPPKYLVNMLDELLQSEIKITLIPVNLNVQLCDSGEWLSSVIQEVIAIHELFEEPPVVQKDSQGKGRSKSEFFKAPTDRKNKKAHQPKPTKPIRRRSTRQMKPVGRLSM